MRKVLERIDRELPPYNDYLLNEFRADQLAKANEYLETTVFKEAIKLIDEKLEYCGSRVMTPEERTAYETKRGDANINTSELILMEYTFRYESNKYTTHLYLPYLKNGYIVIKDTKYNILLSISDKVFTKIMDGIICKVIRSPIKFRKNKMFIMSSVVDKTQYFEAIVTIRIHNRKIRRKNVVYPTIIHYLTAKYGFNTMLEIFDMKASQVYFTDVIDKNDTDKFEYFMAKGRSRVKKDIFLKVDKQILDSKNTKQRRVIACVLYLLANFTKHTIDDLYDESNTIWKIMLGKCIYSPTTVDASALNYMNDHLDTLRSYLDPITQAKLSTMGVHCNDVYDLMIYVFWHIDEIMLECHSNLYNKRIDVLDMLLGPTIIYAIYTKFYKFERRRSSNERQLRDLLSFQASRINSIYDLASIRMSPSMYNCNTLFTKTKKTRISALNTSTFTLGAPELRFHPSFLVVESAIAFSQNSPGITGTINPCVPTDEDGNIVKPDYSSKIDEIGPHLPYKTLDIDN